MYIFSILKGTSQNDSRKIPVKLYFHKKGQFLDLSGRMGYKVYPSEKIGLQIITEQIELLPRQTDDGNVTCINSTYDECMYRVIIYWVTNT